MQSLKNTFKMPPRSPSFTSTHIPYVQRRLSEQDPTLRKLNLTEIIVGPDADSNIAALRPGLASSLYLTTLLLNNNGITVDGAIALSHALSTNISLTALHLDKNLLADTGCSALGRMLACNTSLTFLSLRTNLIGVTVWAPC